MRHRIVLTRPDASVSSVLPSENAIRWMCNGGRWPDKLRGWFDEQMRCHLEAGHSERVTARYLRAMQFGGCSTQEALAIIRDRDCAHRGTGIELWDVADIPSDRWFRDAWRRSHNGGPIYTDMKEARVIQMKRIQETAAQRKAELQEARWRERIRRAETPEQLKNIWPKGLVNVASV
jgi:hypothetical protein